jgi:hypothetical protein
MQNKLKMFSDRIARIPNKNEIRAKAVLSIVHKLTPIDSDDCFFFQPLH